MVKKRILTIGRCTQVEEDGITEAAMTEEEGGITEAAMTEDEDMITETAMTEDEGMITETAMTEEEDGITEAAMTEEEGMITEAVAIRAEALSRGGVVTRTDVAIRGVEDKKVGQGGVVQGGWQQKQHHGYPSTPNPGSSSLSLQNRYSVLSDSSSDGQQPTVSKSIEQTLAARCE